MCKKSQDFFSIFDVCNFFLSLFSLFNWRGSCFVAGFGFRRSRKILVGRPLFCWRMSGGRERGEVFGACRRKEKGGLKKETPV